MQRTLILTLVGFVLAVLFVVMVVLFSYMVDRVPREKRVHVLVGYLGIYAVLLILQYWWTRYVSDPNATIPGVLLRNWPMYAAYPTGWCLTYVKEWWRARRAEAAGEEGAALQSEGASPAGDRE
ncbi:MAG TPA: hypothetical protein VK689_04900 [Armatimonadota bacterium]|nr:hypothetical protein [Armatimonadota bacterium]